MEGQGDAMLDSEFRRYLKILKPYMRKILDKDVIQVCNGWIHKLSKCNEMEKTKRNKYMFTLCYQLARGTLRQPFTRYPSSDILDPLSDKSEEDIFSDVENLIEDSNIGEEYVPIRMRSNFSIEFFSNPDPKNDILLVPGRSCNSMASSSERNSFSYEQAELKNDCSNIKPTGLSIEDRAKNLILKLREMKYENVMLRDQLASLKDEAYKNQNKNILENFNNNALKSSPKGKINTESRINLSETINSLQEKLCHYNEIKNHEIEILVAKHNLEILKIKTEISEEAIETYKNKVFELTQKYENTIENMRLSHEKTLENLRICKENKLSEKDEIIKSKEMEILRLNKTIEELETQCNKVVPQKSTQKLEKRIRKIEKSSNKYFKALENKLLNMQLEKHSNECSLQIQLVKEKEQIVSEITDGNRTEMVKALEKLENKYKEIVAQVQATALKRKMRDQLTLETLMKAICYIPNEHVSKDYQLGNEKKVANPNGDVKNNDLCHSDRIRIIFGNKSIGMEDNIRNTYHDDNEMIHIPQKDNMNDYLPEINYN